MRIVRCRAVATLCITVSIACSGSNDGGTGPSQNRTLTVVPGRGVIADPATTSVRTGTTITYKIQPAPGYGRLVVRLDDVDAPQSGSIVMNSDHTLAATADSIVSLSSVDSSAISAARQLLTASDPVRTVTSLIEASWNDAAARGAAAAAVTLDHVQAFGFDQELDGPALASVAAKLSGKTFSIDLGDNSAATSTGNSSAAQLPMSIIFINGMGTGPEELDPLLFSVRNIIAHSSLPNYSKSSYRLLFKYNATAYLRYPDGGLCLSNAFRESFARKLGIFSLIDRVNKLCGKVLDFTRAIGQVVDLLNWIPSPSADAADLATMIQTERRAGRGVILLGHSQGTLIAQQGFKAIGGAASDPNSSLQRCTGFISVAGPAPNQVLFRHQANFYAQGVRTKDIIFHVPTTSGNSGFATDTTQETDREALSWTNALQAAWGDLALGLRLHALVGSYFTAVPMRDSIQKIMRDQVTSISNDCVPTATRLAIVTQPISTGVGATLDPAPAVEVLDADGNRVGSSSASVTVGLSGSSSALTGTNTVQAVNGVATFSDLRLSASGTYQLAFTSAGLTSINSAAFTIAPPPCVASSVAIPFTVTGDLRTSQCTFINAVALPYDFNLTTQRSVRFRLSGNSFIPRISVLTRDRSQSQSLSGNSVGPASLVYLLAPGPYTVAAGSEGGTLSPFVFDAAFVNENTTGCESVALLRPSLLTTAQSLSTSDCNEGGSWSDIFVVGGSRACSITMRSSAFDAYLDVHDRTGAVIASDDDSGGGTDARVVVDPCYSGSDSNFIFDVYVHATSYYSGAVGPYTLEFRFDLPSSVQMQRTGTIPSINGGATALTDSLSLRQSSATRVRPPKH